MGAVVEKVQKDDEKIAPVNSHFEQLNDLQLALVGGGSVTVLIG